MKKYIRSTTLSNTLYHGGRSAHPKVASQKELGIHVSTNTEEARVHFVTVMTKCNADVSNAIDCEDMNNWASLEAFKAILQSAGIDNGDNIAVSEWRANDCQINTVQASTVMRDCVLAYGITCIHYVDAYDIPGADCYILLEDTPFEIVTSLEEGWPNLAEANKLLPETYQIRMHTDCRPYYYEGSATIKKVPKELFLASPEEVVDFVQNEIQKFGNESQSASSVADVIISKIKADFNCDVKVYRERNVVIKVLLHSDSFLDISNPSVAIVPTAKRITIDRRFNRIEIPANADIDSVYEHKVYPFIQQSL